MLDPAESQRCAEFLEPFAKVFTVNYDLLLHWVIADNDRLNSSAMALWRACGTDRMQHGKRYSYLSWRASSAARGTKRQKNDRRSN